MLVSEKKGRYTVRERRMQGKDEFGNLQQRYNFFCLIGHKQKKQSVKNYQKLKEIRDMRKILIIGMVAIAATACNVTRTITTRSEAWQKGDTSVVIQTKTVETYDASRKLP